MKEFQIYWSWKKNEPISSVFFEAKSEKEARKKFKDYVRNNPLDFGEAKISYVSEIKGSNDEKI